MCVKVFGLGYISLSDFLNFVKCFAPVFCDSYEYADYVASRNLSYSLYLQFDILV